jgi:shikimate kinase
MSPGRNITNLALVGFMGTGKSTVGQLVAGMLHFQFIDTDEMIENMARKRISDIFAQDGEARFRAYEHEAVHRLKSYSRVVIAAGGGLVCNPENLAALKEHALVVCLWSSPETIFRRVSHQNHRPLLRVEHPRERITELLAERAPHYKQADVLLSTEFRSAREVASHVLHQFRSVSPQPVV